MIPLRDDVGEQGLLPFSSRLVRGVITSDAPLVRRLRALEFLLLRISTCPGTERAHRRLKPEREIQLLMASLELSGVLPGSDQACTRYQHLARQVLSSPDLEHLERSGLLRRLRSLKYALGVSYLDRNVIQAAVESLLLVEYVSSEPGFARLAPPKRVRLPVEEVSLSLAWGRPPGAGELGPPSPEDAPFLCELPADGDSSTPAIPLEPAVVDVTVLRESKPDYVPLLSQEATSSLLAASAQALVIARRSKTAAVAVPAVAAPVRTARSTPAATSASPAARNVSQAARSAPGAVVPPAAGVPSAMPARWRPRLLALLMMNLVVTAVLGGRALLSTPPTPEAAPARYQAYRTDVDLGDLPLISARRVGDVLILVMDDRWMELDAPLRASAMSFLTRQLIGKEGIQRMLILDTGGRQLAWVGRETMALVTGNGR